MNLKSIYLPNFFLTKLKRRISLQDYKNTMKVSWIGEVAKEEAKTIPLVAAYYDHIITKAVIGKDEDWKEFINYDSVVREKTNNGLMK